MSEPFLPIEIVKKSFKLIVDWDGMGYSGPYKKDLEDPEGDSPLLRMAFFEKKNSVFREIDGSCLQTYLVMTDPREQLEDAADLLMDAFLKLKQEEWTSLNFRQLAYCHIWNGKPAINLPKGTDDD